MNISEAELLTGITKQNIRFYEKKGLLSPKRNQENSYREYTPEDIETLKQIKILRKLDVSLENIQKILNGEDRNKIIEQHLHFLSEKQKDLDAAVKMCRFFLHADPDSLNTEAILLKMEQIERKGGRFMNIIEDYKKIKSMEAKKGFSFLSDHSVATPSDFTVALCQYGLESDLNLIVTKESMRPKFEIDGLEYEAFLQPGFFNTMISCRLTQPLPEECHVLKQHPKMMIWHKIYLGIRHFTVPIFLAIILTISGTDPLFVLLAFLLFSILELSSHWQFKNK